MADTEEPHKLKDKLNCNSDNVRIECGQRVEYQCINTLRQTVIKERSEIQVESLKKAFQYLESELHPENDELSESPETATDKDIDWTSMFGDGLRNELKVQVPVPVLEPQPESNDTSQGAGVDWDPMYGPKDGLRSKLQVQVHESQPELTEASQRPSVDGQPELAQVSRDVSTEVSQSPSENRLEFTDEESKGDDEEGEEGETDSGEWSESTQAELPSVRDSCSRCWCAEQRNPFAREDCTFIHPSGDVYQHEEPNLPVLPFTIGHPKKVSEADCKWFHALESENGSGGVDIVLKWLNWPWQFSLWPDFVDVAVELLDYCLNASDPGESGSNYFSFMKLKIYAKEKEKSMVLLFDEVWTKIRNDPNLKEQLPKLSLIFLKFLFSSDGKLSEAIVTLRKVLDDDSSKDLDKEQFAIQFCEKLDKCEGRYDETRSRYEEDNLLGRLKLMTKLACLFGPEIAEKHFLPRFIALTSHKTYEVRQLCVYRIHEMVHAVSESAVETHLLPAFLRLCHDKESKVRSPCLLGIIALSSKLPMKLRITVLAPVYCKLLNSQKALHEEALFLSFFPTFCPFITTLAYQPIAVLELNQDCDVVLSYLNDSEFGFDMNFCLTSYSKDNYRRIFSDKEYGYFSREDSKTPPELDSPSSPKNNLAKFCYEPRVEKYKSFEYWREPVDDCYVHSEVINIMSDKWTENLKSMQDFWNRLSSEENWSDAPNSQEQNEKSVYLQFCEEKSALKAKYENSDSTEEEKVNCSVSSMLVSSMLVKYYLSERRLRWVTSNVAAESLAIFLPAVAFTLGYKNWPLLKSAFNVLATHEEWKIRLAIASIIHELALLLSKEQTEEDLLPVFKSIMEDLDPVRLGALRNMASFLGSLNASARTTFLTRFSDFLGPDFRLREVLVDQLISVLPLFSACDIITFILPFVILVLQDKIAAVRQKSINLACELSLQVHLEDKKLTYNVLKKFTEHLASSSEWRHRQTFANLASALCVHKAASPKSFNHVLFPHLFSLCNDTVVNVRIATARSLRDIVLSDNLPCSGEDLKQSLQILAADEDPDVRELSSVQGLW